MRQRRFWGADAPARTNSRGWRDDDEFGAERLGGVRRIVLERDDVEVLNFGVNAYGTDQELREISRGEIVEHAQWSLVTPEKSMPPRDRELGNSPGVNASC